MVHEPHKRTIKVQRLLKAAGTRPEPAVSVPNEKLSRPSATATADPALDPPEI